MDEQTWFLQILFNDGYLVRGYYKNFLNQMTILDILEFDDITIYQEASASRAFRIKTQEDEEITMVYYLN